MFKFVALVALVASANAGLIASPAVLSAAPLAVGNSIAVGPALGATLLGRTTVNAPETTIVKQQVVVDQPEIRYRSVPTVVQTAPVVQQQVIAAPQLVQQQVVAAPQVAVARSVVASPQIISAPQVAVTRSIVAPQVISAPQVAVARSVVAAPQIATIAAPAIAGNSVQTLATPFSLQQQLIAGVGSQTLLASPVSGATVLTLKK